jgi:thymidine phosphorylase
MQQVQQVGNQGKRQPRAKVASMQAPLLSEGSPEEQVKEALALLYGEKSTASSNTQQRSSTHTRRRYRRP